MLVFWGHLFSNSNDFKALGSRFPREGRMGTLVLAQRDAPTSAGKCPLLSHVPEISVYKACSTGKPSCIKGLSGKSVSCNGVHTDASEAVRSGHPPLSSGYKLQRGVSAQNNILSPVQHILSWMSHTSATLSESYCLLEKEVNG